MKAWQLINVLSSGNPDDDVVIPVVSAHVTVGRSPVEEITSVRRGMDWDNGRVFLQIGENKQLTTMSQPEYHEHIRYKQAISSVSGRENLHRFLDDYVKKTAVLDRLHELNNRLINGTLENFEIADLINDLQEEI